MDADPAIIAFPTPDATKPGHRIDRDDRVVALRDLVCDRIAAALPPDVVAAMGPRDLVAKAIAEACLLVAANVYVANRRGVPFGWMEDVAVNVMRDRARAAMRHGFVETFGKEQDR